jgi:hypothetical protein
MVNGQILVMFGGLPVKTMSTLCVAARIALLSTAALSTAASAATVDNASLADPPGVYFGAGNANSNFTIDTEGNVEVGLSAITRFVGPLTPVGNSYFAPTGATALPHTGSVWGFDFSVNLNAGNQETSLNLSQITTVLTLQDLGTGTTGSFDILTIPDNSLYGASGKCFPSILCGNLSGYYAAQNSETLSFASVAGALNDPLYDMNADDTYIFTLEVFSNSTDVRQLLASDQIQVVVGKGVAVPEPVTLSLFGAGLAGAFALRRRKRKAG